MNNTSNTEQGLVILQPRVIKFKIVLSVLFVLALLVASPVNGSIVSFSTNPVTSSSDVDNYGNIGDTTGDYTSTNNVLGNEQVLTENNVGNGSTVWNHYKEITIDGQQVSGTLEDFPVLISLVDPDLKNHAQQDGDDIAFFDQDGNQLSHQIEIYDPNYSGTEAQLVAWVKTDLSQGADTLIVMRYGNSELPSQQDSTGVWDSGYSGIWHLNDDPSTAAPQIQDSSSNGNDGTTYGSMSSSDLVTGKIGGAIDFDGSNDYINLGNDASLQITGAITLEAWFYGKTAIEDDYLLAKSGGSGNRGWDLSLDPDTGTFGWAMFRYTDPSQAGYSEGYEQVDIDNWYHIAGVFDPSTAERFYLNGALVSEDTISVPASMYQSTVNAMIALRAQSFNYFEGMIDEVRVSSTARSTAWLSTGYNNQNDPGSFYSISAEKETPSWDYSKNLYIDNTMIDDNLYDFPVLVSINDSDIKNKAQADGDDIAFFDEFGRQLNHEIEVYQPNFNSTHARLVAWVTADLFKNRDTLIEMRYGNPNLPNQENSADTWNQYNHVWHLNDDPSTTAPQMLDSKSTLDGTSVGTMGSEDLVNGKISSSLEFDGVDDHVDVTGIASNDWTSVTVSVWFYKTASGDDRIFGFADSGATDSSVFSLLADNADRAITARIGTDGYPSSSIHTATGIFSYNTWNHAAITWDSSTSQVKIYVNGDLKVTAGKLGTSLIDSTATAAIGNANADGITNRFFTGMIDEVRVSQLAKNDAWFKAEFANQNNPSTFYQVSEERSLSFSDSIDMEAETDGISSKGGFSSFGDIKTSDGRNSTLSEITSPNGLVSLRNTNDDWMIIDDGNVDWAEPKGTISFWIRFDDFNLNYRPWGQNDLMEIDVETSGLINLDWGINNALSSSYSLSSNTWYYLAIVWNEDADTLELYIGTMDNFNLSHETVSWTSQVSNLTPNSNNFMASNGGNGRVKGRGDDLRFYDAPLSSSLLESNYNYTITGRETNLRSYYPFDDYTYTDHGSDGNDGISGGGALDTDDGGKALILNQGSNQFDWEGKFVDIPFVDAGSNLTIRTGDMGTENLELQYWTGSSWSTLTSSLLANTWNNFTITSYVDSTEFIIRLRDTDRSTDTLITDTWEVDAILLSYTDYGLDWEHSISSVDPAREFYDLAIRGYSSSAFEDYQVDLWDQSSSWISSGITITDTVDWYNTTITNPATIGSDMAVRYTDTNTTKDLSRDSLHLDYVAIESYDVNPVMTYTPGSISYSEGTATYNVNWQASDDNPGQYSIYLNEVLVKTNTWNSSSETITYNTGGLARGTHNLKIIFDDTYTGQIIHQETVTVTDDTDPAFTETPVATEINETTSLWKLNWTATDLYNDTYELYKNGSLELTGNWNDATRISIDRGLHTKGVYNYTLVVFDESGNSAANTVYVTVLDETAPTVTPEGTTDFGSYELGSSNNILSWTAFDSYEGIYIIEANGTQVNTSSWISGNAILQNIDNLAIGDYNYTIIVFDSSGNIVQSTIIVKVRDTTSATISQPSDIAYEEDDPTIYEITWALNDLNPNTFTIYKNGAKQYSAPWASGDITIDVSGLSAGTYIYTIEVTDDYGNLASDSVSVVVSDTASPQLPTEPSNKTITESSTNNQVKWVVTDNNPDTYVLYQNNTQVQSSTWTDGGTISRNIDALTTGRYNFTLVVYDEFGNQNISTVWITVSDVTNPVFSSIPNDLSYYWGTTSQTLSWTATDNHDANYTIYRDGQINSTGIWNSGVSITQGVNGLDVGTYSFTIVVQDASGNTVSDTVLVTVYDNIDPNITDSNPTYQYNEGSTSNELNWTATDDRAGTYIILKNGTQVTGATPWISGIQVSYNIDGLLLGDHNFTIVFQDTSGNEGISTTIVSIIDQNDPIFTDPPADQNIAEGDPGNSIVWQISDTHPGQLTIYRNGSLLVSNSWTSGTTSIDIDGLSTGMYNYTISISDTSGNVARDTVWISVYDDVNPVLNQPTDVTVPQGEIGNEITWVATDLHPSTYAIYQNGTLNQTGNWVSGGEIAFNLDGLSAKPYNFTIVLQDESGNTVRDTIIVTVTADPVYTNVPSDVDYVVDNTGNSLSWTINDIDPDTYIIYENGTLRQSGDWISGSPITYDIDGLSLGVYNFTIFANDSNGNIVTDLVYVTVSDMPAWDFQQPAIPNYSEGSTGNVLQWNATDMFPDTYVLYLITNDTVIDAGTWTNASYISVNIDGLTLGEYNFTIYISDTSGNTITHWLLVTVIDTTDPEISQPSDVVMSEGDIGREISWTGTDLHPDTYTIEFSNGTQLTSSTWTSDDPISYPLDGFRKGSYTLIITIYDKTGNFVTDTVFITVEDTTDPTINTVDSTGITFSEGTSNNWINVTASDSYNATYEIYIGLDSYTLTSANYTGVWNSSEAVNFNLDSLLWGQYNYTIVFIDQSGNTAKSYTLLTVQDTTAPIIDEPIQDPGDTFDEGTSGNWINVTASDSYNATYEIYIGLEGYTLFSANYSGIWNTSEAVSLDLDNLKKGVYNYTIVFTDQSGNTDTYYEQITVTDGTIPVEDSVTTTGTTFNETSIGNTISVTASDAYASTYEIYIGLDSYTLISANYSGTWISGQSVIYNMDDLLKGTYNYTIIFTDESGNILKVQRTITVVDETVPVIDTTDTTGTTFSEGSLDNWINVTASDSYNATYEIYIGLESYTLISANYSGMWNSNQPVNFNLDSLVKGAYNFTIVFIDETGNTNRYQTIFTVVDNEPPTIDLVDIGSDTFSETSTGNWINVTASDSYNATYEIYIGLDSYTLTSANYSGMWNSAQPVPLNLDSLTKGIYNYTIVFTDESGNTKVYQHSIIVTDGTAPTADPIDTTGTTFNEISTGNWINVTAYDTYNATYEIYIGLDSYTLTSANYSGMWNSAQPVSFNLDALAKGRYNYTIVFIDESGNTLRVQTSVTVLDETNPTLSVEPDIGNYIEGSTGNWINWTASDNHPDYYEIYYNSSLQTSQPWTGDIEYNIDGLAKGLNIIEIRVYDSSGNVATDIVEVTVIDTTDPLISQPPDITMAEGDTGVAISWIGTDNHAGTYQIVLTNNGTTLNSSTWQSGVPITFSLDGFKKGSYTLEITLLDESGNSIVDSVTVQVLDTTNPDIVPTPTISYEEGTTGNTLSWTATDTYNDTYTVIIQFDESSTQQIASGSWDSESPITVNIDGYLLGQYTIILTVYDESGNSKSTSTQLEVFEITPPVIQNDQQDVTYVEGEAVVLNWTVTDDYNATYIYYVNSVQKTTGTWDSGTQFSLPLNPGDVSQIGTYNITIYFRDSSLNKIRSTVFVTIEDITPPAVTGDSYVMVRRGTTGNEITLDATDNYPGTYLLYIDGVLQPGGETIWSNTIPITQGIDGLEIGNYSYSFLINDTSDNELNHTVWVEVVDGDPPVAVSTPSDITYVEGEMGISVDWTFSDPSPGTYTVLRNGSVVDSGILWESDVETSYILTTLDRGTYNYTFIISDEVYNNGTFTIYVTVLDETDPTFTNTPADQEYTEQTTGNQLSWTMNDKYNGYYILFRNNQSIASDTWIRNVPVTFDIDGLSYGTYNYTLWMFDSSGNNITDTVWVTVYDRTLPSFEKTPTDPNYIEGQTGYQISWTAVDLHAATYNLTRDGVQVSSGAWISGQPLTFTIDGLGYGSYNYSLTVYDESGNNFTSSIIIEVDDIIVPKLTSAQSDTTVILDTTGNTVSWKATDLNPETYTIFVDGEFALSRAWQSEQAIQFNVDGYEVGYYNITINIRDDAGNIVKSSFTLRIKDPTVTDTVREDFTLVNEVYEGNVEQINGTWVDINGEPVVGGNITITLYLQDPLKEIITTTDTNGSYLLEFDYSGLDPGNYTWTVAFTAEGYQSWDDYSYRIEVLPHTYRIELSGNTQLVQGEEYSISAVVYYNNAYASSSAGLGLSAFNAQTGRVGDGVLVEFVIVVFYEDGRRGELAGKYNTTNSNGVVFITLSPRETMEIVEIGSIEAFIPSSKANNGTVQQFTESQLPTIILGDPDLITQLTNFFVEDLPIVIGSILGLAMIFLIILYLRRRERQRIQELNDSIKASYEEIRALESMKALIIQTKTKLTLYEEVLNTSNEMNTTLVGGMVSAFSSFLNELGKNDSNFGFETMQRGDVSLTLHRAFETNIILISEINLPFVVLAQIKEAQDMIEQRFSNKLANASRGVVQLKKEEVHPVLEEAGFKVSLLKQMQLDATYIRALQREKSISRAIKTNVELLEDLPSSRYATDGVFTLGDIIDFYASKGISRKMSSRIIVAAYQYGIFKVHEE